MAAEKAEADKIAGMTIQQATEYMREQDGKKAEEEKRLRAEEEAREAAEKKEIEEAEKKELAEQRDLQRQQEEEKLNQEEAEKAEEVIRQRKAAFLANGQIREVAEEDKTNNKTEKTPAETQQEAEAKRMKIKVDGEEKVDDMSLSEADKRLLRAQEEEAAQAEKTATSTNKTAAPVPQVAAQKVAEEKKAPAAAPAAVQDKPTGTVTSAAQSLQ